MASTGSARLRWADLRQALVDVPALAWGFVYFFCLLCGYFMLRSVRDAFGASQDVAAVFPPGLIEVFAARGLSLGDLTLQVLFSTVFLAMLLLQPIYGALVSRVPRRVFLPVVYGLIVLALLGFHGLFEHDVAGRGAAFFVFLAVINLFAVSVFWSYMSDVFTPVQSRLFYGFIGVGGTLGALAGPALTRELVGRVGVENIVLIATGFLVVCLVVTLVLAPWARQRERERGGPAFDDAMGGRFLEGLWLVLRDPVMRSMALLLFFGVGVGTLLYSEQVAIARQIVDDAERTAFFATIDFWVNITTLVVQSLLTPFLMARFGIAPLLLVPGMAVMVGFALLAGNPLPGLLLVVQVMLRAGEFSLVKPARETIYTRVDAERRYKAKAFIDTAVYRSGDVSFIWVHKLVAGFGTAAVFLFGTLVAACMVAAAWALVRAQRRLPG
ncbi:MFS transporter [Silanimonas sp.]|uniref:NTP/NDP exchange transporter n=1 Tax=Silanimonas sp. TaxID=1929290 RepID=UPI001BB8D2C2|nr:MFS transporter [Silanimonas sp.]MBS3897122.1 MFS transporter [Silanimonas sp.]MBS3923813.1 MFS transporter [Xanthomonadaceae bacterium]